MNQHDENKYITQKFIKAFSEADFESMEKFLDKDIVAYVTNSQSEVDKVIGRDEYMRRIHTMDITSAFLKINITQMVAITENQVLVMVEVKARRNSKILHNFAAYLIKITNGKIVEMWMVEALPAYSEEFWIN